MRRQATTPQERAVEVCAAYLDNALDDVINARLALDPDQGNWSAPTHAIGVAHGVDAEWSRGSRHLMGIETRLRELIPERRGLDGHLDEFRTELPGHVERSAEIGWRVGGPPGFAAVERRDADSLAVRTGCPRPLERSTTAAQGAR